jgi:hypothetical protein
MARCGYFPAIIEIHNPTAQEAHSKELSTHEMIPMRQSLS